jgi:type IV pilus assembly protein PilB
MPSTIPARHGALPFTVVLRTQHDVARYLAALHLSNGAPNLTPWRSNLAIWRTMGGIDAEPAHRLAQALALPLVALGSVVPSPEAVALVPPERARELCALPVAVYGDIVAVAMEDPADDEALATLRFLCARHVQPLVAGRTEVRAAIGRAYDSIEDARVIAQLGLDPAGDARQTSAINAERLAEEKPVVRMIQHMIAGAIDRRASDIHIRPGEDWVDLLFRIDNELVPVRRFLRGLLPALVSRIKVLGRMNLAEHRTAQDGRSTFQLEDGRTVDLRFSVLPTIFGESVVIRLLDTEESLRTLGDIGLGTRDKQLLDTLMQRSHGMFLATGPTGCGKSTTLYAMLLEMRQRHINILTIEDPVEYHIADVQQMQVNRPAGFTFATALRNFLRHDPDVIMVGEIRDRETADIAVESALTGHLVLSTLHTNTAATTITRMLDLGVEGYLLRASLLAVMAQRLVRLTCPHCREVEDLAPHMRAALGVAPEEVFHRGRGCTQCSGLGVHGRMAVYELMEVTPAVRQLIVPGAEADRIHAQACADGMVPITAAAVALARSGRISLSEAWRVRAD